MTCKLVNQQIETLTLAELKIAQPKVQAHLLQCEQCNQNYQQHYAYLSTMQAAKTPDLHPADAARMFENARTPNKQAKPSTVFMQGFIAASVLAISILGTYTTLTTDEQADELVLVPSIEASNMLDTDIVLVINSPKDMLNADLDLVLPQQVSIVGLDNIQQLSWPVDLKAGANTLELPIRVNMDKALEQPLSIMATLYHEADERNFEIDINLTKS